MNIQQFQYILAVSELKHFEKAAKKCFISQSTLSTMIARFENEIGIKIFDRKTKPVSVTKEGEVLINQIRVVYKEIERLNHQVQELKGEMVGDLNIGIIPTVAPYLLPLFLTQFANQFPEISINVQEMTTPNIQLALKKRELDIGIVAIPLKDKELIEFHLYDEPFILFDSLLNQNKNISIEDIDYSRLYLLEEGHCLRTQVEQICGLSKLKNNKNNIHFKVGSIDSLVRFTKLNKGITFLPYMAIEDLKVQERLHITYFSKNSPLRSIGLIVYKDFVKVKLLNSLNKLIKDSVDIPIFPNGVLYAPI